jgi:anti-sigma B factor antagonist
MELQMIDLGDIARIALSGRLDTVGVGEIETRFTASVVPQARDTVVDLSEVTFVSSMGIRMLIGTARALSLRKARLVLFGAQPLVLESLGITGLDAIVPIVADESEALANLRG